MARSFETVTAAYPRDVQTLATEARRVLSDLLPGANEEIDPKVAVVSYGYGSGYKAMVCTLILSKGGVKLGIVNGAKLPDPDKLLEGAGKSHKYIPIRTADDLRRPAVKKLVEAARRAVQGPK